MKLSTILGITLLVLLGSLWAMHKMGSGRGNHIWHNDFNQARTEWVMTQKEKNESDIPELFDLLEELEREEAESEG